MRLPIQVQGIVFRKINGKIQYLLLKRVKERGGFWQAVTGGLEEGETKIEALRREALEETGVKNIVRIVEDICYFQFSDPHLFEEYVFGVEVSPDEKIVIDGNEHYEYRWCSFEEAVRLLKWKENKEALKKLNDYECTMMRTEEDVKQVNNLVDVRNKSVLEIGCGTGRITFLLAKKAREIAAIDIQEGVIEEALGRNRYENVRFSVGNIETVKLGKKFDVILSTWMGYMYLNDVPKAIRNVSNHLEDDGVFLLLCGYYEDEFTKIVRMLIGGKAKSISFCNELETVLSEFFTFEKHILKGELVFSSTKDTIERFRLELKNEYSLIMDNHHEQQLKDYLKNRDKLAIGNDSLAYLCRKHV